MGKGVYADGKFICLLDELDLHDQFLAKMFQAHMKSGMDHFHYDFLIHQKGL